MIKRYIVLNYQGENHEYWRVTKTDKEALLKAVRQLEIDLGRLPGSLRKHFLGTDKQNSEIHLV